MKIVAFGESDVEIGGSPLPANNPWGMSRPIQGTIASRVSYAPGLRFKTWGFWLGSPFSYCSLLFLHTPWDGAAVESRWRGDKTIRQGLKEGDDIVFFLAG